jgi:hypothetical protein
MRCDVVGDSGPAAVGRNLRVLGFAFVAVLAATSWYRPSLPRRLGTLIVVSGAAVASNLVGCAAPATALVWL